MAEIPFEYLAVAPESTRGTAVTPPTHILSLAGTLTPNQERAAPEESSGVLAARRRSKTVHRFADLEAEGSLDTRLAVLLAHSCINGAPAAPTAVTVGQTWLWTFSRTMTSDNLDSLTAYFGDPNIQIFQGAYGMLDEWTISSDAAGTDLVSTSIKGRTRFPTAVSAPTLPARIIPPLFAPAAMQLWMDTSSAMGTTEITGRFLSCELSIPTGVTYKWFASGPTGGLNMSATGREKTSPSLKLVFEFLDSTQYNLFANSNGDTVVRSRVRLNSDVIESTNRHYVEWDMWAPLDSFAWGENAGSNRTLELTGVGEYDTTAATDLIMRIQTNSGTV